MDSSQVGQQVRHRIVEEPMRTTAETLVVMCSVFTRPAQVGGRLGTVFDEDPKRWRMLAEALATAQPFNTCTTFLPNAPPMQAM